MIHKARRVASLGGIDGLMRRERQQVEIGGLCEQRRETEKKRKEETDEQRSR
jgi:hypothetical protein